MTIDDSSIPRRSVQLNPSPMRSKLRPVGVLLVGACVAVAALGGLGLVAAYFLKDRTAITPAAQTVTVTASPKAPVQADGADGVFLLALGTYGIKDNGTEAVRQRFMELAHLTCFSLMPPKPQPLESTVNTILTTENQDVAAGNPWSPTFTHDDAEHLADAAIGAYCPNAQG